MRARIVFHCAAVVVLLATVAFAQSKPHDTGDEGTTKTDECGRTLGVQTGSASKIGYAVANDERAARGEATRARSDGRTTPTMNGNARAMHDASALSNVHQTDSVDEKAEAQAGEEYRQIANQETVADPKHQAAPGSGGHGAKTNPSN